jgi:general stress protein YciG
MSKALRGFASLSPERRKEVAAQGGRKAHETGTAHTWTSDEAREAGRKGGLAKGRRGASNTAPAAVSNTALGIAPNNIVDEANGR